MLKNSRKTSSKINQNEPKVAKQTRNNQKKKIRRKTVKKHAPARSKRNCRNKQQRPSCQRRQHQPRIRKMLSISNSLHSLAHFIVFGACPHGANVCRVVFEKLLLWVWPVGVRERVVRFSEATGPHVGMLRVLVEVLARFVELAERAGVEESGHVHNQVGRDASGRKRRRFGVFLGW